MVRELFVTGSLWFWLLVLAQVGWLSYCVIKEEHAYKWLLSIAAFVLILQLFSNTNILLYISQHYWATGLVLILYLIGAVLWIFPRWFLFVTEHHAKYIDLRDKFLFDKNLPSGNIPENLVAEWTEYWKYNAWSGDAVYKPSPRQYKDRIINWMAMWPLSFVWTIITFFGVKFFRLVYYRIAGLLQQISDNVFKNEATDFEVKKG